MSMPAVDAKPIKSPKLIRYSSISDNSDKLIDVCLCGDSGSWDGEECVAGIRTEYDWLNYVESLA